MIASLLALPAPARAHKLNVFAHAKAATIVGHVYFSGDIAARQTDVIARDPAGRELSRTKTDDQGNFSLPIQLKIDYHLTAETADGHASSPFLVSAAELPDSLPAGPTVSIKQPSASPRDPAAENQVDAVSLNGEIKALQAQVELLRSQVDQSEQRLQLRDLLGGIGYILGLAGLGFYFKARQRNSTPTSRNQP